MSRWVLVVEDEPELGEMLCDNLRMEGYEAELIRDGTRALERIRRGGIDLILLDIMLPGTDGFTILEDKRRRDDPTPVLVLSARISDADKIRGLSLEADDYLTKPFNLKELLLRIGALLRRRAPIGAGADTLEFAGNNIDFRSHMATNFAGEPCQLTPTEVKLMRLLSGRPGEVVARREIVETLFGPQTAPTSRSLDNTVLSLRTMFERDNKQPKHFHTIRGVGLRFTPEEAP